MIGKYTPKTGGADSSSGIFEWRNGPLTLAIKNGYSGVFDNISCAPSKVIESLNALLDPKDTEEDYFFDIPQNVDEPKIRIHKNFLFIGTCILSQMEKLAPAFLNRFTVINLEDQLEDASENEEKNAIKYKIESEKIELNKKEEIIDIIHKIFKEYNLNIASLSRFTKATVRLFELIKEEENLEEIINYMKEIILTKNISIDIPIKIQNIANNIFNKN